MANEYSMLYGVDENGYVKTGLQGQVYKNKEDIELLSNKIETAISGVVTKDYVDGQLGLLDAKVDTKLTKAVPSVSGDYLYTTTGIDGTQGTIKYSQTAAANQIAQYGSNGNLQTATPTATAHAANKSYVDQQINNVSTTVNNINSRVTTNTNSINTINSEIAEIQSGGVTWVNNVDNKVSSSAMFQIVHANSSNKVTVDDSLFTSDGHTIFVKVKGISGDITTGKIFEKANATIQYDSNVREIDTVGAPQHPVFLINCFLYNGIKVLNVSTLSAFA